MECVLVIDDDDEIRKLISDFLIKENFQVETAKNGNSAVKAVIKDPEKFSIVILDIMLPDISGVEVCRQIRKSSNVPIIMLTAKSEDTDKIAGLEVGADDYLTKPFNPKELVARIKAILRRSPQPHQKTGYSGSDPQEIKDDIEIWFNSKKKARIFIKPASRRVFLDGNEIKLTNKEYNVLVYFIENRDIVIKREKLLENIWGYDFIGESRTIDVHIKELRKKLGDLKGNLIETVWSVGYRFNFDNGLNNQER